MSDEQKSGARFSGPFNPVPLIAVALLAAGVVVKTIPLETSRPQDSERRKIAVSSQQDVEARLWQDPFAAVDAELITLAKELNVSGQAGRLLRSSETRQQLRAKDDAHGLARFRRQFGMPDETKEHVTLLAAMVFSGTYPEDTENRRRNRYAVLAGLIASGYTPDDAEHIGYFWTDADSGDTDDAKRIPPLVRYEWFRSRADPNERVLVVWLEDELFGDRPLSRLSWLMRTIACDHADPKRSSSCAIDPDRAGMAVIGPAGSDTFRTLFDEANAGPAPPHLVRLQFFSPYATAAPESEQQFARGAWKEKCFMTRTIGGDDALIGALLQELQLRGALPQSNELRTVRQARRVGVVLVTEGDTDYSNKLAELFKSNASSIGCKAERGCVILPYTYLRGLDGILPEGAGAAEASTRAERSSSPRGAEDLLSGSMPRERASGRSHYDYMRRLADQLDQDRSRDGHEIDIKAIGIFGNDVYDKLIVLQALHDRFPHAVFFTTDLDARLLQPEQAAWTRNLVVASNFGLALNPGIQRGIPPFRDAYQSAGFLATVIALSKPNERPEPAQLSRWLGGKNAQGLTAEHAESIPDFYGKRLFEIGRHGPVELDANGAGAECTSLRECANIHSLRDPGYPKWNIALTRLLVMLGLLTLLLLMTWRRPLNWLLKPKVSWGDALGLGLVVLGGSLLLGLWFKVKDSIDLGIGEPFLWFAGVSMWPAQVVRLVSIALSITFLALTWHAVRKMIRTVEQGDFALRREAGFVEASTPVDRWLRGPLRFFDDPRFIGDTRLGRQLDVERLWTAFCNRFEFWQAMRWIVLTTLVLFALEYFVEVAGGRPFIPHRGELVQKVERAFEMTNVLFATLLLVTIVYVIRTTRAFLLRLADNTSRWPPAASRHFAERLEMPADCLDDWIDFQLVVRLTSGISHLIYFPFVILVLAVIVRSSLFDAVDLPLSLQIMIGLSLAYAIHSAYILRRAAERARGVALRTYDERVMRLTGQGSHRTPGAARVKHPERLSRQYEILIDRIRATREGAFSPISQQPVVRAILLTLGGFGGVSLAEYLSLANL